MRGWSILFCLGLFSTAMADRLIDIPTGRALPKGMLQFSNLEAFNQNGSRDRYLAFAPLPSFEFAVRQRMRPGESGDATLDFAYNLLPPVASVTPGISVGVLDALDETLDGQRTYLAMTFRELLEVGERGAYGEVTLGVQFGSINTGFFGASLPMSQNFRLLAEHNGYRISAGFEYQIAQAIRVRAVTQEGTFLMGLNLSRRF